MTGTRGLMLHFLAGSSERSLSSTPTVLAATSEDDATGDFDAIAADEPLPGIRRGDYARLLVQSPQRLYLYWNFARDPFTILRRMSGERIENYTLGLRLINAERGAATQQLASSHATSAWLDVEAGRSYRMDVGLYAAGRPFIKILSSNIVRTPRAGVSPQVDAADEFRVSPVDFTRTLSEAGYVNDAIEVWLEAADEATGKRATRVVAEKLAGAETVLSDAEDLAQLRHLIGALATGAPLERLRAELSPTLVRWLERAEANAEGAVLDRTRLLDVLRATFEFELEHESFEKAGDAQRRSAIAWTGSDVRFPSNLFHVWLPSMTAGVAARLASPEN